MGLLEKLPLTTLGWAGNQPPTFDMGVGSQLHNVSSIVNDPNFSTYLNTYLRTKLPSELDRGNARLPHYMDNPPH